jgi:hypothetical protein
MFPYYLFPEITVVLFWVFGIMDTEQEDGCVMAVNLRK